MFASKTPRDLNHDPKPWDGNTSTPENPDDNRYSLELGAELVFIGFAMKHAPRPEFDHVQHNEPNPILVEFRSESTGAVTVLKAERYLALIDEPMSADEHGIPWSRDARDHARRVLTPLARLAEVAS